MVIHHMNAPTPSRPSHELTRAGWQIYRIAYTIYCSPIRPNASCNRKFVLDWQQAESLLPAEEKGALMMPTAIDDTRPRMELRCFIFFGG